MVKTIPLTQGKVAIVDNDVYEWASKFKWHAVRRGQRFYASRTIWSPKTVILLHREIIKPPDGYQVDHVNGDGLDNRHINLRLATAAENLRAFKRLRKNKSSRFRGVHWSKQKHKWRAEIKLNGKNTHLGYFDTEETAARTYDLAAKRLFGTFSYPNFQP